MAAKKRPRTGERRKARQPLKIDRLPVEVRDQIQQLRAQGRTWQEIEELSTEFVKWDSLTTPVLNLFPDLKLPHSSLARWYDLRVDQVLRETMVQAERSRQIASAFAKASTDGMTEAVQAALRDQVFALVESSDELNRKRMISELQKLARLLVQQRRVDVMERKQTSVERELEVKLANMKQKVEALKKDVEEKKQELTPAEMQQRLDEIYGLGA